MKNKILTDILYSDELSFRYLRTSPATSSGNRTHQPTGTLHGLASGSLAMFCSLLRSPVSILQAGSTRYSSCTSQPPCPLSSTTGWGTASMVLTGSRLYVADPVKPTCALLVQGLLPHAHMEPLSCLLGVSCPTIPSSSEALTAMSTSSTLGMVCLSSMELISMQEVSVKAKL